MRHSIRDFRPGVERLEERAMLSGSPLAPADSYVQTNLVSNVAGVARITDPELVDPWDLNFPQLPGINPPVVVADQGSGVATSYQISPDGLTVMEASSPVAIPTVGRREPSGPTGVVQNTHPKEFLIPGSDVATTYIFDTLQGTIVAYNGISAEIVSPTANKWSARAMYTGLAVGTASDGNDLRQPRRGTAGDRKLLVDQRRNISAARGRLVLALGHHGGLRARHPHRPDALGYRRHHRPGFRGPLALLE